mmetsp:Transcript_4086/g.8851  ORF Transcript_4086/g.8851 Transcript_4086/m.8851 type:complete len:219 (-) Transcript_4086:63-719(-)
MALSSTGSATFFLTGFFNGLPSLYIEFGPLSKRPFDVGAKPGLAFFVFFEPKPSLSFGLYPPTPGASFDPYIEFGPVSKRPLLEVAKADDAAFDILSFPRLDGPAAETDPSGFDSGELAGDAARAAAGVAGGTRFTGVLVAARDSSGAAGCGVDPACGLARGAGDAPRAFTGVLFRAAGVGLLFRAAGVFPRPGLANFASMSLIIVPCWLKRSFRDAL